MSRGELSLKGKCILLLYARFFGYDKILKEKLESLGAKVDLFDARANINTLEKAIKKINPKFYYKKQRKFHKCIQTKNRNISYDYIFSNENIEVEILNNYRSIFPTAKMILYLDDSVANMVGVDETFACYDEVLTFDRNDAKKYNISFRPLFYCDAFKGLKGFDSHKFYDICFVGTCHSDRLSIINTVIKKYPNYRCYWYCYLQSWFMYYYYRVKGSEYKKNEKKFFKYKQMKMDDVAKRMSESTAVLDIQHPMQTGLTMRTIETLGLEKKIITTNKDIVNYDFYIKDNILVIERNNPIIPESFISNEYIALDDTLYFKYSIDGWIKDIFSDDVSICEVSK